MLVLALFCSYSHLKQMAIDNETKICVFFHNWSQIRLSDIIQTLIWITDSSENTKSRWRVKIILDKNTLNTFLYIFKALIQYRHACPKAQSHTEKLNQDPKKCHIGIKKRWHNKIKPSPKLKLIPKPEQNTKTKTKT